jgi:hypothetical protein
MLLNGIPSILWSNAPSSFVIELIGFLSIIETKYMEADKSSLKHKKMKHTYYETTF